RPFKKKEKLMLPNPAASAVPTNSATYDHDAIQAFLNGMLGEVGVKESIPVDTLSIRRLALALDDLDPIRFDEQAARKRGYKGIVAPHAIVWLAYYNCTEYHVEFPFGKSTLHGEDTYEMHTDIIAGDTLTVSTSNIEGKV